MEIKIEYLLDGAKIAKGLVVIIDVFRAFTTACFAIKNGVEQLYVVADVYEAYDMQRKIPNCIIIGEKDGLKQEGFEYGNSPSEIQCCDFSNKKIIQVTSAGTKGVINAINANEVITGSFVNAKAIATYIEKNSPKKVTFVCMGDNGIVKNEEDQMCAEYIIGILKGKLLDINKITKKLRETSGARFFDINNKTWSPEEDFHLCMNSNIFDFVLRARRIDNKTSILEKIKI